MLLSTFHTIDSFEEGECLLGGSAMSPRVSPEQKEQQELNECTLLFIYIYATILYDQTNGIFTQRTGDDLREIAI